MAICPHCRAQNVEGTVLCGSCGKELVERDPTPRCPRCGNERPRSGGFCGRCGAALPSLPLAAAKAEEQERPEVAPAGEVSIPVHAEAPPVPDVPDVVPVPEPVFEPDPFRHPSQELTSCQWCGAPMGMDELTCPSCYRDTISGEDSSAVESGAMVVEGDLSGLLNVAGVLLILVSVMAFGTGVAVLASKEALYDVGGLSAQCCCLAEMFCGPAALMAAWLSFKRRQLVLALIGASAGVLTVGPAFVGSIMSFIALALIVSAYSSFKD